MDISDIIQIISIICTSSLSIIAIIISVITLKQSSKAIVESSRANIMLYFDTPTGNSFIVLKNFGNSVGKVLDINISPKLQRSKSPQIIGKQNVSSPFDFKNITLAPNQSIKSWFPFKNYPDKHFQINLKYETLGKIYNENYCIDINYVDSIDYLFTSNIDTKDEKQALVNINNTLMRINEKF